MHRRQIHDVATPHAFARQVHRGSYLYIKINAYIHMHTFLYACANVCTHAYISVCMYKCMYMHTPIRLYIYIYICTHVQLLMVIQTCMFQLIFIFMFRFLFVFYLLHCVSSCLYSHLYLYFHLCLHFISINFDVLYSYAHWSTYVFSSQAPCCRRMLLGLPATSSARLCWMRHEPF